ncbi:MAG: methyltransferase domain-containing protein [Chloroflexaceae bacterium]|nr:methyltransferase domain-containing protein [Chloroflexaceae bacterium]
MATVLRAWSYRYLWLYEAIAFLAALGVGGKERFRKLAIQGLSIQDGDKILDLCCGGGEVTQYLAEGSTLVTALDVSPLALERARSRVPQAQYVEGFAQDLPFSEAEFDLVHTSVALHEMTGEQLQQIFLEVYRVLKSGGQFTFIDFHPPHNPLMWPPLAAFLWLFETETAWQLLQTDLIALLQGAGFKNCQQHLEAGGSLQIIQASKP